jgi:hypothetical protein
LLILLINYYYYLHIFEKRYKNNDISFIKLCNKSFKEISNKLENKFTYRNYKIPNSNNYINKITIKIHFIDIYLYQINFLLNLLQKKFNIIISPENPDYLIYDVFGCEHLDNKYSNSTKIAFLTENIIPDFNTADYAMGHSYINYLDRYFIYPFYFYNISNFVNEKDINKARKKALSTSLKRKKFCAAVISNDFFTDFFRNNFIDELNKYKEIDMGGKYKNNVGMIDDKIKFLSSYKFSIAMENTEGDGYISEKIIDSFIAGTIPIYYGGYLIDEYINPNSFIFIRGEKDINQKIEYIKILDNNDNLYKKVLEEEVFINKENIIKKKKEYEEFIYLNLHL